MDGRRIAIGLGSVALLLGCGPQRPSTIDDTAVTETSSTTTSSTTTETTEDTSEDSSEASSTVSFVTRFDVTERNDCDVFAQDCDEGQKCVPYSADGSGWDAHKCVPVLGDQQAGEPCHYDGVVEATDDCDATSACWDVTEVDGELIGLCSPLCSGSEDAPECPLAYSCLMSSFSLGICIHTCDPILQDCGDGLGCYWTGLDFQCIFATAEIPVGEPCGFINDCADGNLCTGPENLPACDGASCCTAYCDVEQGDLGCAAQPGTACVPFFELGAAPPPYEHVGVCVSP